MIGVEGKWLVGISVGDQEDFLDEDDLIEFTVIEEAGNVLPTFILTFTSEVEDVLPKMNEGHIIKAQLGKDLETLQDIELRASKLSSAKEGESLRIYESKGFASNIDYITDHNTQIISKKSGIEAALEVLATNFDVDSEVTKSNDKQNWIQPSISNKAFVNNCLLHCDLADSFPVYAITADGKFILKDVKKALKKLSGLEPFDWKFTRERTGLSDKEISFDSDPTFISQSGFVNNWLGYGRKTLAYDSASGEVKEIIESAETVLSLSNELDKSKDIQDRFNGTRYLSDNVHEKYWESYNHNLIYLASLSQNELALSFSNFFYDVKPLVIVMFSENANDSDLEAAEYHSGLYMVSKVVKSIQAGRLTTTILLNREALNQIKNEA